MTLPDRKGHCWSCQKL